MRRPLSSFAPAALLALALAATGCQQLFTTSLAAWAERDDPPVPSSLSRSQAAEYAEQVVDNRDTGLAQALLPAMADLLADNPGDPSVLASAAATASVATGLDQAFATALSSVGIEALTSGAPTPEQVAALASALSSVEVGADAAAIFASLEAVAPGDLPALADSGVTAGTFAIAAAAIIIASVPDGSLGVLADGDPGNDPAIPPAAQASASALIALALAQWPADPLVTALQDLMTTL